MNDENILSIWIVSRLTQINFVSLILNRVFQNDKNCPTFVIAIETLINV